MTRILIIGCGYTGVRIARLHLDRGDFVTGSSRSGDIPVEGVQALRLDLDAPFGATLPAADRVYYTAPPPGEGHEDTRLARLLERLPVPESFVYLGTTGVYGGHGGAIVSEETPLSPANDRARRRVHAEELVENWAHANRCTAARLRIAGIYGPGRLPLDRVRSGAPTPDPADTGPGNRIHIDDLAAATVAIADSGRGGAWNVSDGNLLSTAGFNDLIADAIGVARPPRVPLDSPEISPGMRSFLAASRHIDNRKLLSLQGFFLEYPDPAEGIRASI